MCKEIGLPKVTSSSCLWQWWWSSREGSGRISLLCTALSFSGPAGHTLCRNSQIAKVTISKQHFHLSQGFRFPIWEVRSLLAVKTCSITILIQTLQTDRHSMEMSVINGLKNRKDFRREITLLNIESSPGPNHRKHRKSHCQLCLRNDVANLFLVHCILSRPTMSGEENNNNHNCWSWWLSSPQSKKLPRKLYWNFTGKLLNEKIMNWNKVVTKMQMSKV